MTSSDVIEIQKSYDPVSNTSVSIMPPKCEDGDCCLPTSFTYNFKCGICCSVFHTREEKTRHNLLHFIPCTMCRETLRSRDHLLHHLKTVHKQKDLTHVKRHAANCKTYNLPVIPRPNRGPATKVKMVKKVDEVKEGIKVKKEEKEEGMVVNSGLPIFYRYFNALDPLCLKVTTTKAVMKTIWHLRLKYQIKIFYINFSTGKWSLKWRRCATAS